MNIKNLIAIALVGIFILTACEKDFLDVTDPNRLTSATFWQTEAQAKQAIIAAYGPLQLQMTWVEWGPNEMLLASQNLRGDDITFNLDWDYLLNSYNYQYKSTDFQVRYTWDNYYKAILNANLVLENVTAMNINPTVKDNILGEAKFIRAFAHFFLLNNYGNIVLRTKVPKTDDDYYQPQATKAEVNAQIEADLKDAIAKLPTSWNGADIGRATKGAAIGMLGKVYLYQEKWALAEVEFRNVTAMGYSLVSDYESLFNGTNKNSSESLFEIQFSADASGGRTEYWGSNDIVQPAMDFFMIPSSYLHNLYMNDVTHNGKKSKRVYGSIVFNDPNSTVYYFDGKSYTEYMNELGRTELLNKSVFKKFDSWDASWNIDPTFSGNNIIALRYADILLMLAEACNEQGKTSEAVGYVNQVRNRAGSVPISAGMSQPQLRDHIRHVERPIEFAMEGLRFFDLVRWKDTKSILLLHNREFANNFIPGISELWPIPNTELDTNRKVKQNPGY